MKRMIFALNPSIRNTSYLVKSDIKEIVIGTIITFNIKNEKIDGIIVNITEADKIEDIIFDVEFEKSTNELINIKLKLNQFQVKFPSDVLFESKLTLLTQNQLLENLKDIKEVDLEMMRILNSKPNYLNNIHPSAFEDLVRKLYLESGYEVEQVGNWNQGDGGIDLFAVSKNTNNIKNRIAIQCKRTKNKVRSSVLRELNGVLEHNKCHIGIVATTSYFTPNAKADTENGLWKIQLNDRDDILKKLELLLNK